MFTVLKLSVHLGGERKLKRRDEVRVPVLQSGPKLLVERMTAVDHDEHDVAAVLAHEPFMREKWCHTGIDDHEAVSLLRPLEMRDDLIEEARLGCVDGKERREILLDPLDLGVRGFGWREQFTARTLAIDEQCSMLRADGRRRLNVAADRALVVHELGAWVFGAEALFWTDAVSADPTVHRLPTSCTIFIFELSFGAVQNILKVFHYS